MLTPLHLSAVFLINVVFAGAYLAGKVGVNHFPPFFFTALRFFLVFIVLLPFFSIKLIPKPQQTTFFIFCLAMGTGVYGTMYLALSLADGVSRILIGTQFSVPIAALLGVLIMKEKVNNLMWVGIVTAFIGVMAVGLDGALLGHWFPFLLILISASFYALANVLSQKLGGHINVLNLNAWMALITTPIMLLVSFIVETGQFESLVTSTKDDWIALLYSSLVVSLVGHVGMFAILRRYPVSIVIPYYVLTPIFGVIGGIFFFNESPSIKFYVGSVIALVGVYIVNRYRNKVI